jgi:tRNA-Thr(GGU) m(6)t(6)A37 methyltransferase TsaA
MQIEPIGIVRNSVRGAIDENWGAVVSEIKLSEEFAPGLRGLEGFSHVIVVFVMHAAEFDPDRHLVRRPRDQADMPLLGIFAQRARHRPNPIGITTVALQRIEGSSLFVKGLDAIDGSPVLDIKPHVPIYDSPETPSVPEWVGRLMRGYFGNGR